MKVRSIRIDSFLRRWSEVFKIIRLDMVSNENETFTYLFESGINYFKGVNDSGKTEFYSFIATND